MLASFYVLPQQHDGYGVNLPKFYSIKYHFGFTIAGNTSDFRLNVKPTSLLPDTLIKNNKDTTRYFIRTIYTQPTSGFALGFVADMRLHDYIRLRCTPSFASASRNIEYTLANLGGDTTKKFTKQVESFYVLAPLELKFQSKRLGNFSAYVIGGGGYTYDVFNRGITAGSQAGSGNSVDNNVKIRSHDFYYSAGGGTDFYLPYFKLGLEIKLQVGTKNLLIPGNNVFSNSIDKIRSRMVVFTVTFEG